MFRIVKYNLFQRKFHGITSPLRTLPDFIVIGAKRCGTTSLYHYLGSHPSIKKSSHDHLGFFDDNYHLGLQFYRSFFPTIFEKRKYIKETGKFLTYDVTSSYIQHYECAQRIHHLFPQIKLIAILRNPVDRAYSEYNLHLRVNDKMKEFEYYVNQEMIEIEEFEKNNQYVSSKLFTKDQKNYLKKGFYFEQLVPWFDLFPRENIHIISTEQLGMKPNEIMNDIFKFLNIEACQIDTEKKHEKGSYKELSADTRKLLQDFFMPKNKKLYGLIEKNFDWK